MIKKENRLKSYEVGRVLTKGRFVKSPNFSCRIGSGKPGYRSKITVVVSKKVASKAVERNYLKRKTREAFAPIIGQLTGFYIVVFPRKEVKDLGFQTLQSEVIECLKKLQSS